MSFQLTSASPLSPAHRSRDHHEDRLPPPFRPFRSNGSGGAEMCGNSFVRLIAAQVIGELTGQHPGAVAEKMWPSDYVLRAASAPAKTSVTGWAAELAQRLITDALAALGPASAGASLLKSGLVLSFDGHGSISAPGFVADVTNAGWVAEGNPIPVRQLTSTAALLSPRKLAAIGVISRELAESSNAEAAIGEVLIRAAGRALDEVLFDSNAGDAARPAGLRFGVSASSASTSTDLFEAVFEDVAILINAVSTVGGDGPYVLIGSPGRVLNMRARFSPEVRNVAMYASSGVGADLICIAASALVSAFEPTAQIEATSAAAIVMDTAPTDPGGAQVAKSAYQTDTIATKMRWSICWALRDARALAWLTPSWK